MRTLAPSGTHRHAPGPSPESRLRSLFEEYSGRVFAYALRRLGQEESAKDVVSETFTVAWQKIDAVPAGAEALPWLLAVARRILWHQYRSQRSQRALLSNLESAARVGGASEPSEDADELDHLRLAFGSLRVEDQEVLALVDWEGLTNQEAARVLGIATPTFAVRLHRSRRRLASALRAAGYRPNQYKMATHELKEVE
ncbi:MAG: sigma-70 family RNA polymerase sigma factor [Anaerolineae bacterium]|nr:sigma-70 family RNA polymerase sigma factor [Anaerolineae bacterium]